MNLLKFSTRDIPLAGRKDAVESALRTSSSVSVDFVPDTPIAVEMGVRALPGVQLAGCTASSFICRNAGTDDTFIMVIGLAGVGEMQHAGGRVEIRPGHASLAPLAHAWTTVVQDPVSLVSIALPRELLPAHLPAIDSSASGLDVPPNPATHLLAAYAKTLLSEELSVSQEEAVVFATHIRDLAGLILGARGEAAEVARARGLKGALLASVKTDIAHHISNPALSLDWLAKRHGIGLRQIQNMFYGENTSFSEYVLETRLEHARRQLIDPAQARRTIVSIAFSAGFGDLSWFNRVFRRRFGMSPSQMRAGEA